MVFPFIGFALLSTTSLFGLSTNQCGCPIKATTDVLIEINTALEECCENTFEELIEIQELTSSCCEELLADVNLTSSLIFTSTLMSSCVAATNALILCCAQIASNFQQTFTVIADMKGCTLTPILAPTTIAASGSYCLADNITGSIIIEADNVSLDLNGHTIAGNVIINDSNYVKVKGGIISGSTTGIELNGGTEIIYENIMINDCAIGMAISDADTVQVTDCAIHTAEQGIAISNSNSCFFERIIVEEISNSSDAAVGIACTSSSSILFKRCTIHEVVGVGQDAIGLSLNQANQVVAVECVINLVTATGAGIAEGIAATDSRQNYYYNTSISNIAGANDVVGIAIDTPSAVTLRTCNIQNLASSSALTTTLHGIGITNGFGAIIVDSSVTGANGLANQQIAGFAVSNCSSSMLARCTAASISNGAGFLVTGSILQESIVLHQCIAEGITGDTALAHGFRMDVGTGLLNRCNADGVAGSAFLIGTDSGATTRWTVTNSVASNASVGFNRVVTAAPAPGSIGDVTAFCTAAFQNWPFVDVLGDQIDCNVADEGPVIGYNTAA